MRTRSLLTLLEEGARRWPRSPALMTRECIVTYAELRNSALQVARWLRYKGVRPGDRVALFGVNSVRLVVALFGSFEAGAAAIPIHPMTTSKRLSFLLSDASPSAIVTDTELLSSLEECRGWQGPVLLTGNGHTSQIVVGWKSLSEIPIVTGVTPRPPCGDDIALLLYTSGSSGNPQAVITTHAQAVFAVDAILSVLAYRRDDVILCGLPLSFDYGLYQLFLTFRVGARILLEPDFAQPFAIPRRIVEHGVTVMPGVPSLFSMLLRSHLLERIQFPSLRLLTSTGDVFPEAHVSRLVELLPRASIVPMYGLTECKRVSIMPAGQLTGREASVGKPLSETYVTLIDASGDVVEDGETGELIVSGPHVMAGYWNAPEETLRRFGRYPDGSRYLRTGDLFRRDADGFLYFVGRKEMMIKSFGHRIGPAEIERVISGADGVTEVAAIGLPRGEAGEQVWVFISTRRSADLDLEHLDQRCREALLPAARPQRFLVREEPLPRTPNGKLDREFLRKQAVLIA